MGNWPTCRFSKFNYRLAVARLCLDPIATAFQTNHQFHSNQSPGPFDIEHPRYWTYSRGKESKNKNKKSKTSNIEVNQNCLPPSTLNLSILARVHNEVSKEPGWQVDNTTYMSKNARLNSSLSPFKNQTGQKDLSEYQADPVHKKNSSVYVTPADHPYVADVELNSGSEDVTACSVAIEHDLGMGKCLAKPGRSPRPPGRVVS